MRRLRLPLRELPPAMIECTNRIERIDDTASCTLAPRVSTGCGSMVKICAACRKQWPGEAPPTEPTPVLLQLLPRPGAAAGAQPAPKHAPPAAHDPTHCVHFLDWIERETCCGGKREIQCEARGKVTGAQCRQCVMFEDRNAPLPSPPSGL